MSLPIRLAVNLCLIGALLLAQGGFDTAISLACQSAASSSANCSCCGCCALKHDGSRCDCCSKQQVKPAASQRVAQPKSCCQSSPTAVEAGCESDLPEINVCLCGHRSRPTAPASQYRIDVEQLLKLTPKPITSLLSLADGAATRAGVSRSQPLFLVPHAAQRLLCTWQI
jgi:hypothetical protein